MSVVSTAPLDSSCINGDNTISQRLRALLAARATHLSFLLFAACLVFAGCLYYEYSIVGTIGFAMDDAWIHAAVARNFINGQGWGIVPGKTVSVSTSSTWTLLTSFFYLFFSDPVTGTLTLSLLCMLGATVVSYLLISLLTERPLLGVFGTLLLLVNPIVLWGAASGMELPMVVLMLLSTLYVYYRWDPDSAARRYAFPVVAALAAITRPELFLLLPMALADTFWQNSRSEKPDAFKRAAKIFIAQTIIISACIAPYLLFNKISSSLWFPTTYYAKVRVRGVGLSAAIRSGDLMAIINSLIEEPLTETFELLHKLMNHNLVGLLLIVPGMVMFLRRFGTPATARGALLVMLGVFMPWIMGAVSPAEHLSNHADRYYVIFPPMVILFSTLGLEFLLRRAQLKIVPIFLAILMLLSPIRTTGRAATLLAYDVDSTERLYRQMGLWVKENLPPDAVLAVNDIGGLAYFSQRDFIDVMGLSSPEIWPAIERSYGEEFPARRLEEYLRAHEVQYLILSPKYYPIMTKKTKVYEPIMRWEERYDHHRTIAPQILYRCHWDQLDRR